MKYGDLIKQQRAILGLTQQDLADYTELSLRIIKSVESEKGNPSLKTLEKIADVLGIELIMRVKSSIDNEASISFGKQGRFRHNIPANEHLTIQIASQVYKINTAANALAFFCRRQSFLHSGQV